MRRTKGHRYVREYRTARGPAWALYEHDGARYRRVGTARSRSEADAFLGLGAGADHTVLERVRAPRVPEVRPLPEHQDKQASPRERARVEIVFRLDGKNTLANKEAYLAFGSPEYALAAFQALRLLLARHKAAGRHLAVGPVLRGRALVQARRAAGLPMEDASYRRRNKRRLERLAAERAPGV